MAIIYSYPKVTSPLATDVLVLTDTTLTAGKRKNQTKSLALSDLASYVVSSTSAITGTGTTDTIPVFTTPTTIGDSVMTKVNGGLQIAGGLTITDFLIADGGVRLLGPTPSSANVLTVNGRTEILNSLSVSNSSSLIGTVTANAIKVNGLATFNWEAVFEEKAEFQGAVADSQGNVGTAGQVLSSTVAGVQWVTDGGGSVTGTGTNLTTPMWYGASPTNNLADSPITFRLVDTSPGIAQPYGLQFGTNSVASGNFNSVALGYGNLSSNKSTLATGFGTTASGLNAASFNFETIASGQKSAAFGNGSKALGSSSFAIGFLNVAATSNAFAGGLNSTANPSLNGTSAFAYGNALNVTGEDAASFGKGNTVSGKRAFSAGTNNQVLGDNSFSLGSNNIVSGGNGLIAIGFSNTVSTFGSIAIGQGNSLLDLTGNNTNQTVALGYELTTGAKQYQVVVGKRNEVNNGALFVVGTGGTSGNLKNGLEVYSDKVVLPEYGSGAVTGTAAYNIQVDAAGKIIETQAAGDYKELVALINQVGTQAPTTQLTLSNTLGVALPPAWTRISTGVYNLNAPGKFHLNKTIVFVNNGSQGSTTSNVIWEVIDTDNLRIKTPGSDSQLTTAAIEIRTYI